MCASFTSTKADLIAVTEVGKLNSAIERCQCEDAGIDYYEWSAAMDGRTRESHALMDGKICKWGDDDHYWEWETGEDGKRKLVRKNRTEKMYHGAPGTDFRCRCVALPYVPEYEDDYEAEREKGEQRGVVQTQEKPKPIYGKKNIEMLGGLFEGKRNMLYAGEENADDPFEFRISREQERITYIRRVMKDYDFVAKRDFNKDLQKDFNIYAKKDGSNKLNAYMRAISKPKSAVRRIHEYDESISRMVRYISSTPIQRNQKLYRKFKVERTLAEEWKKSGYVTNASFSSFSTSDVHSQAFISKPSEKEVLVEMVYEAKKGDKIVAPPYRIIDGRFIGYPEECEFTAKPGRMKIKGLDDSTEVFKFTVVQPR